MFESLLLRRLYWGCTALENKEKVIRNTIHPVQTQDGAGVKLNRVFGNQSTAPLTDPFLLLDHFGSNRVEEYISGFPWHPHRGIETVTYLLEGKVNHEDSEGNKGTIYPSDLQWMTAGSGIFHQEMPRMLEEHDPEDLLKKYGMSTNMSGFQLWINIPANEKMTTPVYRDIKGSETPVVENGKGASVKIIAGKFQGVDGSFSGRSVIDATYLDVNIAEDSEFTYTTRDGYTTVLYNITGEASVGKSNENQISGRSAMIMSREGDSVTVSTEEAGDRFIVLSGKPLNEQIAWYGPIVMNSRQQIEEALLDLRKDTFVKEKNPIFE